MLDGFNDQVQKAQRCFLKSKAPRVNSSAGHPKPSDLLGRVFSFQAIASSPPWVKPPKSLPWSRYCRNRPLGFSWMPRCQRLCWSSKYTFTPARFSQPLVRLHFQVLIVSQRQAFLRLGAVECLAEVAQSRFSAGVFHLGLYREPGSALHPSANSQAVGCSLDAIALLVPRHPPLFDFRRPGRT